MADNTTPGAAPTVATDDIGGVHFQRFKLALGADGVNDGDVSGANPLPVAGTVTGPLTDAELRAAAVPVSLASVPSHAVTDGGGSLTVDGTVAVSNFPASQAVTGTFWQATQPVSGTVTVGNASLAVTGTFWQATQPVSIAATVAVSGPLTDAQLRATAVPVSGTFWQATQPVSLASLPALAAGTNNIGDVDVLTLPALPTGTNTIGGVKIKDENRVRCCIKFHSTSAVAETLLSMVKQLGDAADPGGAQSIGVTSGKRLKITSIVYTLKAGAAAAAFATLNVRSRHDGATVIGSPSVLRIEVGLTAATSGSAITETVPCDLEFSGTQTLGVTLACQATTNVHSITLIGYEYTP